MLFPWCLWSCFLSSALYLWVLLTEATYTCTCLCVLVHTYGPCYMLLLLHLNGKGSITIISTLSWIYISSFSKRSNCFIYCTHTNKSLSNIFSLMMGNESTHAIHMTSTWFLHFCTSIIRVLLEVNKDNSVHNVFLWAIRGMNWRHASRKG